VHDGRAELAQSNLGDRGVLVVKLADHVLEHAIFVSDRGMVTMRISQRWVPTTSTGSRLSKHRKSKSLPPPAFYRSRFSSSKTLRRLRPTIIPMSGWWFVVIHLWPKKGGVNARICWLQPKHYLLRFRSVLRLEHCTAKQRLV
jgi:hypothetical protein